MLDNKHVTTIIVLKSPLIEGDTNQMFVKVAALSILPNKLGVHLADKLVHLELLIEI